MKNSTVIKICIFLCIISFCGSWSGYVCAVHEMQAHRIVSERNAVKISKTKRVYTESYLVKGTKNSVRIYCVGSDGSQRLYDEYPIPTDTLPDSDKTALSRGIKCESISEAMQLAEDFSS